MYSYNIRHENTYWMGALNNKHCLLLFIEDVMMSICEALTIIVISSLYVNKLVLACLLPVSCLPFIVCKNIFNNYDPVLTSQLDVLLLPALTFSRNAHYTSIYIGTSKHSTVIHVSITFMFLRIFI